MNYVAVGSSNIQDPEKKLRKNYVKSLWLGLKELIFPTAKKQITDDKNLLQWSFVFFNYECPMGGVLLIRRKEADDWKLVRCSENSRDQLLLAPFRPKIKCEIHP